MLKGGPVTSLLEHLEGKYEILGQLEEDGAGETWRVRHLFLDEVRLFRVIRPPGKQQTEAGAGYLKEARGAMRLRHPNIVQLHDFSLDDQGHAFIILEAFEGLPLDAALRELGPPPAGLALEIGQQALRGLGYLHRGGLVHGDVAPERLALGRDIDGGPLVKWGGLGLSRLLADGQDDIPMASLFPARPRYAAPEQFSSGGGREADARSDLYSLGLVLYELLTGRFPISGHDPFSYMAGHLSAPPLPFAESDPEGRVPEDLREVLLQMLVKDPAQRAASAEEVAGRFAARQDRSPLRGYYLDRALVLAQERAAVVRPYVPPPKKVVAPAPPPAAPPEPAPGQPGKTKPPQKKGASKPVAPVVPVAATPPAPVESPAPSPVEPPLAPMDEIPIRGVKPAREIEWDSPATDFSPPRPQPEPPPPAPAPVQAPVQRAAAPVAPVTPAPLPQAPPPPAAHPGDAEPPAPSRSRGLLIAAILGLALLGGAAAWFATRGGESAPPATESAATAPLPETGTAPEPAPVQATPQVVEVTPQPVPPPPPDNEKAEPSTEELRREIERLKEDNERRNRREAIPSAPPGPLGPMKRGDLITPGPNVPGVEYPEPVTEITPNYPQKALGSGRRTRVRVAMLVDENGNVVQTRVRDGDPSGLGFNEAALEAARRARYLPATRDGIPGKFWTEILLEFEPPSAPAPAAPAEPQAPPPAPAATTAPATEPAAEPPPASPPPPSAGGALAGGRGVG
jgi:TonB family protein